MVRDEYREMWIWREMNIERCESWVRDTRFIYLVSDNKMIKFVTIRGSNSWQLEDRVRETCQVTSDDAQQRDHPICERFSSWQCDDHTNTISWRIEFVTIRESGSWDIPGKTQKRARGRLSFRKCRRSRSWVTFRRAIARCPPKHI